MSFSSGAHHVVQRSSLTPGNGTITPSRLLNTALTADLKRADSYNSFREKLRNDTAYAEQVKQNAGCSCGGRATRPLYPRNNYEGVQVSQAGAVRLQGMGDSEGEAGPAAVRAEAEGGALLVAALLRCMRPSEGGDSEVQAR